MQVVSYQAAQVVQKSISGKSSSEYKLTVLLLVSSSKNAGGNINHKTSIYLFIYLLSY